MANVKYGLSMAAKEHLAAGQPLTRLEAMVLFGVSNLPTLIAEMRKQGWIIKSRTVPYAAAVTRVNKFSHLEPPKNLPVRDIRLTEYWMSR